MTDWHWYKYLTYSGILPFYLLMGLQYYQITTLPYLGSVANAFLIYAFMILVYISGSHWGLHFSTRTHWHSRLPVLSNINVILLWIAYFTLAPPNLILAFFLSIICLLLIDWCLFKESIITQSYWRVRLIATICVGVALILFYYAR